jgi:hypothetical protein
MENCPYAFVLVTAVSMTFVSLSTASITMSDNGDGRPLNNFWMAHKPQTMSELYSHPHEELEMRLEEVERVGHGFELPKTVVAPNAPKISDTKSGAEIERKLRKGED